MRNLRCQIRDYRALALVLACRLLGISIKWDFLFILGSWLPAKRPLVFMLGNVSLFPFDEGTGVG